MLQYFKTPNLSLLKKCYSNAAPTRYILEHLKERSLIRVTGEDVPEFLQGLITNDVHHLSQLSGGSMYSMFLNTKGRMLYDTILYRPDEHNTYFIECDKNALNPLQKHLKMHRVRRKVDIASLDDEYMIYTLFNFNTLYIDQNSKTIQNFLEGTIVPCDKLKITLPETSANVRTYKNILMFKDPRVAELGSRIVSKVGTDMKQEISEIVDIVINSPTAQENYKVFRYTLGIGEGLNDLPSGGCFPLECNCDYLHGVSFHKGCYIGQELTARTHHTGVVRKRLMPLYFSEVPTKLPADDIVLHENVNLGKLRGIQENVGLALLRINQALDFGNINVGNGLAKVKRPSWWPVEATKERINKQKTG